MTTVVPCFIFWLSCVVVSLLVAEDNENEEVFSFFLSLVSDETDNYQPCLEGSLGNHTIDLL